MQKIGQMNTAVVNASEDAEMGKVSLFGACDGWGWSVCVPFETVDPVCNGREHGTQFASPGARFNPSRVHFMHITSSFRLFLSQSLIVSALTLASTTLWAHGDVTPQAVDTHTLPQLGAKWQPSNPYSSGPAAKEALRIGTSAYNQNCARCHGLEAISGGIAPDLRKMDADCTGLGDEQKRNACFAEMDEYYVATVRRGRTRDGRVYMPPFESTLSQEAIWAIRTYLETRREK
jgi:cytochrome c-550 PedF